MTESPTAREATIRALLRRLRGYCPSARTLRWLGEEHDTFRHVAAAEGFTEAAPDETAEVAVAYCPDESFTGPLPAEFLLVVARDCHVTDPAPALLSRRAATKHLPLGEWITGWARPLLVSPAVAHRLWETKWPGHSEWTFGPPGSTASASPLDTAKFLLVTFFGTGLSPVMPATVASAFFVPLGLAVLWGGGGTAFLIACLVLAVLSSLASLWLERWAERRFLAEDPRQFVLDEVAGLSLTWALLPDPITWWGVLLGFVAFRFFDIFKWGVHWVERLPIRGKVLWDDLLAGLYAGIVVRAALSIL